MISAVAKRSSYPALSMRGRSGPPIATTVAWVEPEMAPNRVHDTAAVTARPPRRWPKKVIARSSRRLAVRPRVTISAARMNIGTVISATGLMPLIICWMMMSSLRLGK